MVPALDRLDELGAHAAALTNSPLAVVTAQLQAAGILDRFEHVLSCETVRQLKPGQKPYRMAADALGVPIGELRLIAAHGWDVAGALFAGAQALFVERPGQTLLSAGPRPAIVAPDLVAAMERLAKSVR